MRDLLRGLLVVLMTSRTALWLHVLWHGGRPCPRAVRQLTNELWMRNFRAVTGIAPSAPDAPLR